MRRLPQFVLFLASASLAWLWMQAIHEFGHVLGGWLTGASLRRVILHPMSISRTDFDVNPNPLIACWSGPVLGSLIPIMVWLIAHFRSWSGEPWLRFFAGFCLVANGAYLAIGSFDGIGDAGDLLRHGSPIAMLWLFGAIAIPAGLRLWHRLGPAFGLGAEALPVRWSMALRVTSLLILTVVAESLLSER